MADLVENCMANKFFPFDPLFTPMIKNYCAGQGSGGVGGSGGAPTLSESGMNELSFWNTLF